MLNRLIENLYIGKSKIEFRDQFGNKIDPLTTVGELFKKYPDIGNQHSPDFYVHGIYRKIDKFSQNIFYIAEEGPDILLITGIPTYIPDIDGFKLKKKKFTSYFQDRIKGALFQITSSNVKF